MRKSIGVVAILLAAALSFCSCSRPKVVGDAHSAAPKGPSEEYLYPESEPSSSGYLRVSEIHELYWEVCGAEDGLPLIVLHGGPGGSAEPRMRRFGDPRRYRMILFDQRGAGRSRPVAEVRENTTQLLIEDINALRRHLGVTGKAILLGGSWGSTLAVAYAEAYPELVSGLVLRGVFLGSKAEIDHFYHGGTATFFPRNFERLQGIVPHPERLDYPRQLFEMIQGDDAAARKRAIDGWAFYEIRMVSLEMTEERCLSIIEEYDMTPFSLLENFYMANGCFLEDGQLLRDAHRIAHIPTFIVNGRYDAVCPPKTAYELASRLQRVRLEIPVAAHTDREPAIAAAMVEGLEWVRAEIEKNGR